MVVGICDFNRPNAGRKWKISIDKIVCAARQVSVLHYKGRRRRGIIPEGSTKGRYQVRNRRWRGSEVWKCTKSNQKQVANAESKRKVLRSVEEENILQVQPSQGREVIRKREVRVRTRERHLASVVGGGSVCSIPNISESGTSSSSLTGTLGRPTEGPKGYGQHAQLYRGADR